MEMLSIMLFSVLMTILTPIAIFRLGNIARRGFEEHNAGMRAIYEEISRINSGAP